MSPKTSRQEFNRARLEAGAANHHRQQAGAFENAAVLEVNALADALATFERSELHHANVSSAQRRELENEANVLFRRQVENLKSESLVGYRSEIARIESLAEERNLAFRASMHSELSSAISDSQEAQRIASGLSSAMSFVRNCSKPISAANSSPLEQRSCGN